VISGSSVKSDLQDKGDESSRHSVVCCSVLQCVLHCVLQCVAVCSSVCCSVLQCVAMQCVAMCCSAVCCSVMQCVAAAHFRNMRRARPGILGIFTTMNTRGCLLPHENFFGIQRVSNPSTENQWISTPAHSNW